VCEHMQQSNALDIIYRRETKLLKKPKNNFVNIFLTKLKWTTGQEDVIKTEMLPHIITVAFELILRV
jgi:hypothetical protein